MDRTSNTINYFTSSPPVSVDSANKEEDLGKLNEFSDDNIWFPDSTTNHEEPSDVESLLNDFKSWNHQPHNHCIVTYNDSKSATWTAGKQEIKDIIQNVTSIISGGQSVSSIAYNEQHVVTELDCIRIYFGESSAIFGVFQQCLQWSFFQNSANS